MRPYKPVAVFDKSANILSKDTALFTGQRNDDLVNALRLTSIVTEHATMPVQYKCPTWLNFVVTTLSDAGKRTAAVSRTTTPAILAINGSNYSKKINGKEYSFEPIDDLHIANTLRNFLCENTSLVGPMKQQGVRRLYVSLKKDAYMLVGTNKYCNNVKRAHRGEDVYYIFTKAGVQQYCWSQRTSDTDTSMMCNCREYRSDNVPLSTLLCISLFDQEIASNSEAVSTLHLWNAHNIFALYHNTTCAPEIHRFAQARVMFMASDVKQDDPLFSIATQMDECAQNAIHNMNWPEMK
jgi:hypothetical protein